MCKSPKKHRITTHVNSRWYKYLQAACKCLQAAFLCFSIIKSNWLNICSQPMHPYAPATPHHLEWVNHNSCTMLTCPTLIATQRTLSTSSMLNFEYNHCQHLMFDTYNHTNIRLNSSAHTQESHEQTQTGSTGLPTNHIKAACKHLQAAY